MNLQWNLIRRCLAQCALLAGPGVVMGAVLNGLFAKFVLPYNWSWPICWSYGVQAARPTRSPRAPEPAWSVAVADDDHQRESRS